MTVQAMWPCKWVGSGTDSPPPPPPPDIFFKWPCCMQAKTFRILWFNVMICGWGWMHVRMGVCTVTEKLPLELSALAKPWTLDNLVSRSQTLYLKKQRGKGLVKLPWQIGSDLTGFLRCWVCAKYHTNRLFPIVVTKIQFSASKIVAWSEPICYGSLTRQSTFLPDLLLCVEDLGLRWKYRYYSKLPGERSYLWPRPYHTH